jgi:hypothetical protein
VETPADRTLSSPTTSSAGTIVGRAPGGDAARDHALLPRYACQAVDGSVPSPVNDDHREQCGFQPAPQGSFAYQPGGVFAPPTATGKIRASKPAMDTVEVLQGSANRTS